MLYEDDEVLALNKPAGLAVQGGTKTTKHIDRLLSAWGEGLERPRLVHRLDRDTSGVLVLGKTPGAAAKLAGAFAKRRAQKTYWAHGRRQSRSRREGVIELPLVKKGVGDREMVRAGRPQGPARRAGRDRVRHHLAAPADRAAWMALRPHTGRTHQLRAHMLAIGHPILGDPEVQRPRPPRAVRRAEAAAARAPAGPAAPVARQAGPRGAAQPGDDAPASNASASTSTRPTPSRSHARVQVHAQIHP